MVETSKLVGLQEVVVQALVCGIPIDSLIKPKILEVLGGG